MSTNVSSVVSHFPDAENGFTTTLASTISSGAVTVPLNSVAGYTNGQPAVFVVDPTDPTKKQTFTGIIDTAGVQVTSAVWTAGTNQTHTTGATVVDYATATHIAMISKGIQVQHTQAGAHTAVTATSLATTGNISSSAGTINAATVSSLQDTSVALSTYRANVGFDFVVSGGVWTADSVGVNLNASMTAAVVMINGRRISIGAVTARAFTLNVDTYIDILDNADGTGTLVYTTAATNAASPALAANSIRIGIIQAAATITATTKVNQGQENKVFPIASSVAYTTTDSLGNLICPRDPNRKILGYKQIIANDGNTGAISVTTGLTCPVIVPTGRKVRVSAWAQSVAGTNSGNDVFLAVFDGTVAAGTQLAAGGTTIATNNHEYNISVTAVTTPAATSKTYEVGHTESTAGTATVLASATSPAYILVELI